MSLTAQRHPTGTLLRRYTSPGDEDDFTPASLAADVIRATRAHNPTGQPVVVVGHSMGGRVAMRMAAGRGLAQTEE